MAALITTLIDKLDTNEIVRNQVAGILQAEQANQVALATAAAKPDPQQWALEVYLERSNPFEKWLNTPPAGSAVPIVNVWFDSDSTNRNSSNSVNKQSMRGTVNVDIYGHAPSAADGPGYKPGDRESALESQRGARLVRNILMAGVYTRLALPGVVSDRWVQSRQTFQPQIDGRTVQHIVATRLALELVYNELAPQPEGEPLEAIGVTVKRAADGRVYFDADFDYT